MNNDIKSKKIEAKHIGELNKHLVDAAGQLTGSEKYKPLTQIVVPEAKKTKFRTTAPHAMCGCFSCVELGKMFVLDDEELKANVIDTALNAFDRDEE